MHRIITAVLVISLFGGCSSAQQKTVEPGTEARPEVDSSLSIKENIEEIYAPYQKMSAIYVIKGRVDGNEIFYDGTIKSSPGYFHALLKDPIFRSPLFSLTVDGEKVVRKDYLRDRTEYSNLKSYRWVEVFGDVFPFRFFLPLLRGFTPDQLDNSNATRQKTDEGYDRFRYKGQRYETVADFKDGLMVRLFFKSPLDDKILILQFKGRATAEDERYFPSRIYINRAGENDYLEIRFKSITIVP